MVEVVVAAALALVLVPVAAALVAVVGCVIEDLEKAMSLDGVMVLLLFTGLEVVVLELLPRSAAVAGRPVELVANMKGWSASNMDAMGILQFQSGMCIQ